MAAAACSLELSELLFLFRGEVDRHGDDLTTGHPTIGLALEVARACEPASAMALLGVLYPGWKPEQIPSEEREIVARGFTLWQRERRQR